MSTSSDRHLCQVAVEQGIGCTDPSLLAHMEQAFKDFSVTNSNLHDLQNSLASDALALYKKGIMTLLQGITCLARGEYSWATVKFYYSLFYMMRAELAADGVAILRCKSIFSLELAVGEKPKRHNGPRYRGDHIATASLFTDRFQERDLLLSQKVDGDQDGYEWLRHRREWINYRKREFIDESSAWFDFRKRSLCEQIALFCDDITPIYCFIPDYATLAFPLKRAQLSTGSDINRVAILRELRSKAIKNSRVGKQECLQFIDRATLLS